MVNLRLLLWDFEVHFRLLTEGSKYEEAYEFRGLRTRGRGPTMPGAAKRLGETRQFVLLQRSLFATLKGRNEDKREKRDRKRGL